MISPTSQTGCLDPRLDLAQCYGVLPYPAMHGALLRLLS